MYNVISIDITREELIDSLEERTPENIEYIDQNFENIIQGEIECLECFVNESNDSINTLRTIRDNRGELTVTNDEGKEIAYCGYYAEINI